MKKFLSLSLCFMMLTGVLAGCSGNDDQPSGNGGGTEPAVEDDGGDGGEEEAEETEAGGQTASGNYKKDVVIGISGKIISIDPHEESNTQHNYLYRMNFDTLINFNNATSGLEPNVALSWETEDAITYTFELRDDVYFHNGEHMTANDVVFTFKRAPGTGSASSLGNMMEDVWAEDDYTLVVKLVKANVDFPYLLTLPTSSIMNEKAVTEDAIEGPGVGSGAWQIESYEFGNYMKLIRNDNYWGEKALTETFNIRYIPEASARLIALQTGEIDICQDPDTLELSYIEDTPGLELQTYGGSSLTYMAMNYKKEPFNNRDFRLAMCYGIDADEIIAVARNGHAVKPLSLWGWNEYGYNGGTTPYEYDPDLAMEYLEKAYPDGNVPSFNLSLAADRKPVGELIQAQLRKIGVEVNIVELDSAGLSNTTTNGDHDACAYGCGFNVFGDDIRRLICPGTGVNKSHYDNPEVNELMDLAVAETDEAKRLEYYEEVQQILHDDGAYVPIYFQDGFFGVKEGVGGIDYYPTSHHDMSYVYFLEQ